MRLVEVTDGPSGQEAWATIQRLEKLLDLAPRPLGDADGAEVTADAVALLKLAQRDRSAASVAATALANLNAALVRGSDAISDARGHSEALLGHITPTPWFAQGAQLAIELAQKSQLMVAHANAVADLYFVLDHVLRSAQSGKDTKWSPNYKLVLAAFRKLGVIQ